jgi:hypothetical protein
MSSLLEVPFCFFLFFFLLEEREIAVAESEFPSQVYLIKGSSSSEEGGLTEKRGRMERGGDQGGGEGGGGREGSSFPLQNVVLRVSSAFASSRSSD